MTVAWSSPLHLIPTPVVVMKDHVGPPPGDVPPHRSASVPPVVSTRVPRLGGPR